MSVKWSGGLIRKTPVTPAGPLQNEAAPGTSHFFSSTNLGNL